jgi:hypothetical protein
MIMISGWLEQDEDYKRAFGVLPLNMSEEERLTRFYELHCPQRLPKVKKELEVFYEHYDDLHQQVREQ